MAAYVVVSFDAYYRGKSSRTVTALEYVSISSTKYALVAAEALYRLFSYLRGAGERL